MSEDKKPTPISKELAFWVGRTEARKLLRRSLVYPPVFAGAVVVLAWIILTAILWHIPNSAETVSRLFALETFRETFPTATRWYAHLARRDDGPWDVFLPAMLMINIGASWGSAVLASLWIVRTPFASIKAADSSHSELITRTRGRLEVAIVVVIACAVLFGGWFYFMAFGWGFNPDIRPRRPNASVALAAFAMQYLIILIPFALVIVAFLIKFWRMLGRLQARVTPAS